jgi:hypothetical protein
MVLHLLPAKLLPPYAIGGTGRQIRGRGPSCVSIFPAPPSFSLRRCYRLFDSVKRLRPPIAGERLEIA